MCSSIFVSVQKKGSTSLSCICYFQGARAPKKNKCGILPFISNFEGFVNTTEGIFRQSERRSDLEKWYSTFVTEMYSTVVRISREHTKTPAEVIKMENYHHLHGLMAKVYGSSALANSFWPDSQPRPIKHNPLPRSATQHNFASHLGSGKRI